MNFGTHTIPDEHIIIKTKHTFIFTNIRPFLPYHILVSPIARIQHLSDLNTDEVDDLFRCVQLSLKALRPFGKDFTVSVQDGPSAGQTVDHVHVHVIPRKENDLEDNDLIYAKGSLDYSRRTRSFEEMKEEASMLRKHFEEIFRKDERCFLNFK
ncbi:Bis(5'-adenosyl)-triphosphatase [Nosema granulosis]|uniref:Bis(5'-adenosyl)-triphosphatase n=1 Tax=Nosema granulosis TaxID=83296 RepID=A0A9P6KZR7_9MICR|nr:Bis(5'-adenosyl)-triphosphatase [Nosema granulosis]